ncbi:uncharacterized protein LOC116249966 [Nymphaea colorata]|nr:uncharacterized protein LOC116249966 [Nymphaea colorata]
MNPHLLMYGPVFTVGQSRSCNLYLKDSFVSSVLCRLKFVQREEGYTSILENAGAKGSIEVNGKPVKKNSDVILWAGDELVFSSSGNHSYVSFTCYWNTLLLTKLKIWFYGTSWCSLPLSIINLVLDMCLCLTN